MYSTIDTKYGLCVDCNDNIEKPIIAGRCKFYHYSIHRKKIMLEKQKEKAKVRSLIQNPKNKVILASKGITVNNDLELFYLLRKHQMSGICSEGRCTNSTNPDHPKYYRWSICHIVPKALIKSVATNEHNWIELCMGHHGDFDNTFEIASKMQCFAEAKRKFQLFKHLIPPEELRKVNPYLQTNNE